MDKTIQLDLFYPTPTSDFTQKPTDSSSGSATLL